MKAIALSAEPLAGVPGLPRPSSDETGKMPDTPESLTPQQKTGFVNRPVVQAAAMEYSVPAGGAVSAGFQKDAASVESDRRGGWTGHGAPHHDTPTQDVSALEASPADSFRVADREVHIEAVEYDPTGAADAVEVTVTEASQPPPLIETSGFRLHPLVPPLTQEEELFRTKWGWEAYSLAKRALIWPTEISN
jgi:hypothetical protein